MNTKRFTWLSLSLVLLGQATCALPSVQAGNYDLGTSSGTLRWTRIRATAT